MKVSTALSISFFFALGPEASATIDFVPKSSLVDHSYFSQWWNYRKVKSSVYFLGQKESADHCGMFAINNMLQSDVVTPDNMKDYGCNQDDKGITLSHPEDVMKQTLMHNHLWMHRFSYDSDSTEYLYKIMPLDSKTSLKYPQRSNLENYIKDLKSPKFLIEKPLPDTSRDHFVTAFETGETYYYADSLRSNAKIFKSHASFIDFVIDSIESGEPVYLVQSIEAPILGHQSIGQDVIESVNQNLITPIPFDYNPQFMENGIESPNQNLTRMA